MSAAQLTGLHHSCALLSLDCGRNRRQGVGGLAQTAKWRCAAEIISVISSRLSKKPGLRDAKPGWRCFPHLPKQLAGATVQWSSASVQCPCAGVQVFFPLVSQHTGMQILCLVLATTPGAGCKHRACPVFLHRVSGRTVGGTLCMSYHQWMLDAISVLMKNWK